jgi:hypothetical protein
MKKLLLVLAIGAFAACGEGTTTDSESSMDSAANSTLDSSTVMPTDTSATAPADTSATQADSAASN